MKNPRLNEDIQWATPDPEKIRCRDCEFRAEDRKLTESVIRGAILAMCDAYDQKPSEILWKNADCPYYLKRGASD